MGAEQMIQQTWNPRYLAYCKAHGNTPEEQMSADADAFPGGKMCGFILWMGERHNEAMTRLSIPRNKVWTAQECFNLWLCRAGNQDTYTAFLFKRAEEMRA